MNTPTPLVELVVDELRAVGVQVSPGEYADALRSLLALPEDRASQRAALRTTLVKEQPHQRVLETLLDVVLPEPRTGESASEADYANAGQLVAALAGQSDETLRSTLVEVLVRDDTTGLDLLVTELLDRHAVVRTDHQVAGRFHVFRVLRAVDLDDLRHRIAERQHSSAEPPPGPLGERFRSRQRERMILRFERAVEAGVRRRLVDARGAASVAHALRSTLPEDVDFLTASSAELELLSDTLASLPGRLATALARTAPSPPPGPLDFRRTARASLSTGGVPMKLIHRPQSPPQPDLFILADISGSVAAFARFTLLLVHALRGHFHRVRNFVFVDGVDEVTDLLVRTPDLLELGRRIDTSRLGVHLDGHSDYGHTFATFRRHWGRALGPHSVVLVLGDARSNDRDPRVEDLRAIRNRAGRLYWLNPERRATWDDGDSLAGTYAPLTHGMHECRNARQLDELIRRLV